MSINNIYIIIILLISLSCNNQKGWGKEDIGNSFTIKRQQSYNYSEMLSGDLDSTDKIEFDNYKDKTAEKKENALENENTDIAKEKNTLKEKFNTFLSALYDLYNNFIGFFR